VSVNITTNIIMAHAGLFYADMLLGKYHSPSRYML